MSFEKQTLLSKTEHSAGLKRPQQPGKSSASGLGLLPRKNGTELGRVVNFALLPIKIFR